MDETRVEALRLATNALHGARFTEIVEAAEAFYNFLASGRDRADGQIYRQIAKAERLRMGARLGVKDGPESQIEVREPEGVAKADQAPKPYGGHYSSCAIHNMPAYPAGPCDCGFDGAKTRIVRPSVDHLAD